MASLNKKKKAKNSYLAIANKSDMKLKRINLVTIYLLATKRYKIS